MHKYNETGVRSGSALDYLAPMPTLDAILSENIRQIREAMKMTQEEFAEAMGTSQAHISRLETGENFKRMRMLGEQLFHAGADPLDLLRVDGSLKADPVLAEIRRLLLEVSPDARESILGLLRHLSSSAQRERVAG